MLIVKDVLISDAVVTEQFICDLNACKGACCWEGDYGAPLEEEELTVLKEIYEATKPFLTPEGIDVIGQKGLYVYYKEAEEFGTPLLENGACAYLTYEANGTAKCGIEKAYEAGVIDYKKPISCHLYPIRIEEQPDQNFKAMNYDVWDICSAACKLGKKEQLPVYKFVREAIVRKYGKDFYEELDAVAQYILQK